MPDDGSGDINNAIDESMVAKAQNLGGRGLLVVVGMVVVCGGCWWWL